jgi:hypothetical protein
MDLLAGASYFKARALQLCPKANLIFICYFFDPPQRYIILDLIS